MATPGESRKKPTSLPRREFAEGAGSPVRGRTAPCGVFPALKRKSLSLAAPPQNRPFRARADRFAAHPPARDALDSGCSLRGDGHAAIDPVRHHRRRYAELFGEFLLRHRAGLEVALEWGSGHAREFIGFQHAMQLSVDLVLSGGKL